MNRFTKKKRFKFNTIYAGILLFIACITFFMLGVRFMDTGNGDRQEQALRNAMERDVMHCYALEGFYPPSLEYIEDHYGLSYDTSVYIIDYQPIGNNIYPNYTIIRKGNVK